MQITALQRPVDAADIRIEDLAGSKTVTEKEKLGETCRQFEAMLLRQILDSAQKPLFTSPLVKDSASTSIYRDMVTQQLGDALSRSEGIGLARMLAPQLQQQLAESADAATNPDSHDGTD